jgi:SNF2 family DNA or RNA helicase
MSKLEHVPNKYIVTGTLVANNELSFYMPFRFMGPDTVTEADFACFRQRHFYTVDPDQRIWVASSTTKDLVRDLITKSAIGFRKEQCLDLPGVVYSRYEYDFDKEQAEAYEMAQQELVYIIREGCDKCVNKDKCLECDNALLIKNALVCINKLAQICCGFFIETKKVFDSTGKETDVSTIHQMPTNPKLRMLMNVLMNIPEDGKVIIWSTFTEGVRAVCKQLEIDYGRGSYIAVFGSVDAFAAVEKFKADPKLRFMVANQAKAGTGLNIQFSNYQAYFMNDYSYLKRDQSIARQDRKGQTEKVQVIDLVGKVGGKLAIDGIILKALEDKKDLAYCLTSFANAAGARHG